LPVAPPLGDWLTEARSSGVPSPEPRISLPIRKRPPPPQEAAFSFRPLVSRQPMHEYDV